MTPPDLIVPAAKSGLATIGAGITGIWAQTSIDLEGAGSVGLIGVLALLVGRYTFKQLEHYRGDLQTARDRGDHLEDELEASIKRGRELEDYAHRIRIWAIAAGLPDDILPPEPKPPPTEKPRPADPGE